MRFHFISKSERQTEALGIAIGRALGPGSLVALRGDLGAGKTCLTRGIAAGMGVKGRVTSPTFALAHEHEGRIPLFHFDMYRVGSSREAEDMGFFDYLSRGGVCVIEWSENIEDIIPADAVVIDIKATEETTREIVIEGDIDLGGFKGDI